MSVGDTNWTMRKRLECLRKTSEYVRTWGGWPDVLADRDGFEKWLANTLGCKQTKAKEYIDILRGAAVFEAKMRDLQDEKAKEAELARASDKITKIEFIYPKD